MTVGEKQEGHENFVGNPADLERFRTHNKLEINRVLRDLARRRELCTLYFNHGRDFVLSSVISAKSERQILVLDYGADEAANQRLQRAEKIQFIASHNKVRIQFPIDEIKKVDFEEAPAFIIRFPKSMIRVQRREFYRLNVPMGTPINCRIKLNDEFYAQVKVIDISLGGIGLLESDSTLNLNLEPGQQYDECVIELPEEGVISSPIEIRNSYTVSQANGEEQLRFGCRFTDLPAPMNAKLQRYIHRVEVQRRSFERE